MTSINQGAVLLDHGSGGLASRELIEGMICKRLGSAWMRSLEDSAILPTLGESLAFTTDSFVVSPIFFGNGDIGKIAVCGTVNDLAVSGAIPAYLSLAMIIEEGLPLTDLERIVDTIRVSALEAGVKIVCGDTKVVERGAIDKIALNTAGIGWFPAGRPTLRVSQIRSGDSILISGYAGDHGMHILSVREGLGFEQRVPSDCAPLSGLMQSLIESLGDDVHMARDVTRGGLATVLFEIEESIGTFFDVDRSSIPVRSETAMGADMLGVDPLHLANEGCLVVFVDSAREGEALRIMRAHEYGGQSAVIGHVSEVPLDSNEHRRNGRMQPLKGKVLPRLC